MAGPPDRSVQVFPANSQHVPFGVAQLGQDAFTLTWEHGELIRYEDGGASAILAPNALRAFPTRDLIRWGAPLALVRYGYVLLHAATASRHGARIAFVGPGGAGKSTLVRELTNHGWQQLTDDVLAVDENARAAPSAEAQLRNWCNEVAPNVEATGAIPYQELVEQLNRSRRSPVSPTELTEVQQDRRSALRPRGLDTRLDQGWERLDALTFLAMPRATDHRFSLTPVTGRAVFQSLVAQGFGGSPHPEAWKRQFLVYGALAANVRAFEIRVPDGIEAMRVALDDLEVLAPDR